jgi:3',5'-cyclic AMP phosphodiesterase CpdA
MKPSTSIEAAVGARAVLIAALCLWALAAGRSTADAADPPVTCRIALLSDPHVSENPRYADYVANFERTIAQVNAARVDAVLIAGDLTQSYSESAAARFNALAARLDVKPRLVPGNHDLGNKPQPGKPATVTEARVAQFARRVGPPFYAADLAPGVHLIAIASPLLDTGLGPERDQWAFLAAELRDRRPGVTLVLSHYPPFVRDEAEPDDYWNVNAAARHHLLQLLHDGGVTAVLSGHLHRPLDAQWHGISLVGAPALSFGLPAGKQPVGWRLVSVRADGSLTSELRYLPLPPTRNPGEQLLRATSTRPTDPPQPGATLPTPHP